MHCAKNKEERGGKRGRPWLYSLHLAQVTGNDDLLHWLGLQKKIDSWREGSSSLVLVLGLELVCFLPICLTVSAAAAAADAAPLYLSISVSVSLYLFFYASPLCQVLFFSQQSSLIEQPQPKSNIPIHIL